MNIAYNKIIAKLQKLDEFIKYLEELQQVNKKSFFADYHFFGAAEHYLHLSIEAVHDVADLIIIDKQLPRPEERREVFRILFEHKVINEDLYQKFTGITGFRNVLVHEYDKIDKQKVYAHLQVSVDQLNDFKRQVLKFLKKKR